MTPKEQARQLYATGQYRQIDLAERFGVARSTISAWLDDRHAEKQLARRERYRGTCETCGAKTTGCNGYNAPNECAKCAPARQHEERYWNKERVLEAIKDFHARNGRRPVAQEWHDKHNLDGERYPFTSIVIREFGSWANAIEVAGFERPVVGRYFVADRSAVMKGQVRVPTEVWVERLRAQSKDGVAPSAMRSSLYQSFRSRGISWAEACAMAGVRPRRPRKAKRPRHPTGAS